MHPVENIMRTTMEQLKEMVDVNTVIGKPILTAGETMILPVSRLSMGFISGGGEYGQRLSALQYKRAAMRWGSVRDIPLPVPRSPA